MEGRAASRRLAQVSPCCLQSLASGSGCLVQRMRPSPPAPPPERPGPAGDRLRGCQRVKGTALPRALFLGGPGHPFPPPCPDLGPCGWGHRDSQGLQSPQQHGGPRDLQDFQSLFTTTGSRPPRKQGGNSLGSAPTCWVLDTLHSPLHLWVRKPRLRGLRPASMVNGETRRRAKARMHSPRSPEGPDPGRRARGGGGAAA